MAFIKKFKPRSATNSKAKLRPEVLTHPNIPKPLHGLNPRTVKGKEWWDKTRFKAQEKYDYCCAACGVPKQEAKKHQWLEGHEYWDINYKTGVCEVIEIVPLCHYCHNFIHSGRLSAVAGKDKPLNEVREILKHGFKILKENNLKAFEGTIDVAIRLGVDTLGVSYYQLKPNILKWSDYSMLLEGQQYNSLFKNFKEWEKHYSR